MAPLDPLRGFRFVVEIDGIASGGFLRVKGLSRQIRLEVRREGGVNDYEHQLMTQVTYPPMILERGFALPDLWNWAQAAADGQVTRKNLCVRLQNEANEKAFSWRIENAFPSKWSTIDLDAQSSLVLIESIELAHHGFREGA